MSDLDTTNPSRVRSSLASSMHDAELYDLWRCLHGWERDYTFFSAPHGVYLRIDFFLGSADTLRTVIEAKVRCITWSDHAPISISVADQTMLTASRAWRLNDALLNRQASRESIDSHLKLYLDTNSNSSSNPFTLWNAHKAYMRGMCIQHAAHLKREKEINDPLHKIKEAEALNKRLVTPDAVSQLRALRTELQALIV